MLNRVPINVKTEHKFLGITFDKKLNFVSHLKDLKKKCLKSANILKVLAHKSWGSDRICLLRLYNSLIRSRLDYGAIVYDSARPSALKMLDPVHHLGLRLATGAFRTSPIPSLYAESNQMSLRHRRRYLAVTYASRILSYPNHPTYGALQHSRFGCLFEHKPTVVPPLSLHLEDICTSLDLTLDETDLLQKGENKAPWSMLPVFCDWYFFRFDKHNVPPVVIQQKFLGVQKKYGNYSQFYTDGAKSLHFVGSAVYSEGFSKLQRLKECASIYTAELYAVLMALEYILISKTMKSILFVDSQSVLTTLCSIKGSKNRLAQLVRSKVQCGLRLGRDIKFCWVPSHVGILGNERADELATSSNHLLPTTSRIPFQDMKPSVKSSVFQLWQSEWSLECENKLHRIKPALGMWESASHKTRRLEVLLCRLRIGHSFLTHKHLLRGKPHPCVMNVGSV